MYFNLKAVSLFIMLALVFGAPLSAEDASRKPVTESPTKPPFKPMRVMLARETTSLPLRWSQGEPTAGFRVRQQDYLKPGIQHDVVFMSVDELLDYMRYQSAEVQKSGFQLWWSSDERHMVEEKIMKDAAEVFVKSGFTVLIEDTKRDKSFMTYHPA